MVASGVQTEANEARLRNRRAVRTEFRRRQNIYRSPRLPRPSLTRPTDSPSRIDSRALDAASVEARSVVKTRTTATPALRAPAPTPARAVTTAGEHEFSPLRRRYSRFPRRIQLLPARRRRSRLRRAEPTISRTSPPKRRSRYLAQLSRRPITATASSRCRRRPPSTAVPAPLRPHAQTVPSRLCRRRRR